MSAALFAFDDLAGGYGTTTIVRGVAGAVAAGEVLCVLGRNGVGKSTLMKLLAGHLRPWRGTVTFGDRPLAALDPAERRALGMTYCPQERIVFDDLSVRENLFLMRADRSTAPLKPYFARFPILERRLGQHAGTLSGGEKKILSFVRGCFEDAPLVLIDEPTEGVQLENIEHMRALISARRQEGVAFVVVEQNLAFAEAVADRYLVMDQGRVVLEGARDEIGRDALLAHLQV
ncbi:MAG TPA: ATP-binding cassette domain-containing protein [Alphaproteobacteria bacterium]|jgi:branched-chain amino acid transport system ATP-binding protein|nr:ATP-binding cassette domain-containing protein [Alphaproteobacteria bacterium]